MGKCYIFHVLGIQMQHVLVVDYYTVGAPVCTCSKYTQH